MGICALKVAAPAHKGRGMSESVDVLWFWKAKCSVNLLINISFNPVTADAQLSARRWSQRRACGAVRGWDLTWRERH